MTNEVREVDFGILPKTKTKIKSFFNVVSISNKIDLFIVLNMLLYFLLAGLGIFKLFGLI